MVDFIQLAAQANEPNLSKEEAMKRNDALFRALFELEHWLFAVEPKEKWPNIPMIRTWEGRSWVFGYTDSQKLETFLKQENQQRDEGTLFLSMAPAKAREWFLQLMKQGVYGAQFNFGVGGWYIPLKQIEPIFYHLNK